MRAPADRKSDGTVALLGGVASLLLLSAPCRADVAPESGLLVHVCPLHADTLATNDDTDCVVTNCHEVIRSTSRQRQVDFMLFFMTGAAGTGVLESIHSVLRWPQAWQLLDFQPYIVGSGWLAPDGTLDMDWDGYDYPAGATHGSVVPVARFRMNVVGPGRLDFPGYYGVAVLRGSGGRFTTHPIQSYAEAGIECGHAVSYCVYQEDSCEPVFPIPRLDLSVLTGGAVGDSVLFRAPSFHGCGLTAETHAPWCAASVELPTLGDRYRLYVNADAAALAPGVYDTAIEVISTRYGVSRCLPVVLRVEGVTATSTWGWGRVKSLYR